MLPTNRPPFHPGIILLEEFLKPLGISQATLARHLGSPPHRINEVINGHRGISPALAYQLADAFDTTPEFWINLQKRVDLWKARESHQKISRLLPAS